MKNKKIRNNEKKKLRKSPLFLLALFNFLIIVLILIYIIYLRFIPYETIIYDGYAISGKDIANNLLNTTFDVDEYIDAMEVKDQDDIYQNMKSYYIGASKEKNINLNYPIYVNDTLALYNLSSNVILYTDSLQMIEGYPGFTLTSGALYNAKTLERADYHNYIIMRNSDNMYINTKEMEISTTKNKYKIKMNSIINFTDEFITYYTLEDGKFVYNKILDIDMNSLIKMKELKKEYNYKEFLLGLGIIQEEKEDQEENIVIEEEENKKEENKNKEENVEETNVTVEENTIVEENLVPENIVEEVIEPEPEENQPSEDGMKWQKPTVSCTDFVANTYTATTEVSISDPSGVINKAVTFAFYKDGNLSFRSSAVSAGVLKVSKLVPNSTYNVIGTYQYTNAAGGVIEAKFLDQEFKTMNTDNIKPIDLKMKNGQIYPNKIEIVDLGIESDITDEAIFGVSKAKIIINGNENTVSTNILRNILNGNTIKYQSDENLESSTKYKYEIKFYDTANNEMKLNNNTGSTVTSKALPSAKVKLTKQKITSVEFLLEIINEDNVEISNCRYSIYSSTGELKKEGKMIEDKHILYLDDLDPSRTYNIIIYADFDIEDGNGHRENQQIGNATFTTESLEKLGPLQLDLKCDEEKEIKSNGITFNTKINKKTDDRLIDILKQIEITIQNTKKEDDIKNIFFDKESIIKLITEEGITSTINGLESNTEYSIEITAIAKQGDLEEKIKTSYTLKSFTTRKKPAEMAITNIVEGEYFIDFDIYVADVDGASLNGKYTVELYDSGKNLVKEIEIDSNKAVRCYYTKLDKNQSYNLKCKTKKYNETNNNKYENTNYQIGTQSFETYGLSGKIELLGLKRKTTGKNLIDLESNNKWYSQCFDVIETEYTGTDDIGEIDPNTFTINSTRNYGKSYDKSIGILTLKTNQCYVYDFTEYIGKKITLFFEGATVNDSSMKVYLQCGKEIGKNLIEIDDITSFESTLTVPEDGYIGFYLEDGDEIYIKNLQANLGKEKLENIDYVYDQNADIRVGFTDYKAITYNKNTNKYNYYINLLDGDKLIKQELFEINQNSIKDVEKTFNIENPKNTSYIIQIIAKYDISEELTREYVLDEISFKYDDENHNEIKSISNIKEFEDLQPYGNYIILENLDLTDSSTISKYTFGNDNIAFNGSIDFNGKTITKDIYSNTIGKESTSYIFYNIGENAKLKNIVIDFEIDNKNKRYSINEKDGIYSLFLYNNGSIDNLKLTLTKCNTIDQRFIGLVGYENRGTIDSFIIELEKTLYGTQYMAGCCLYSSGIIQNGYMYVEDGAMIKATNEIVSGSDSSRYIGGLVYTLRSGGVFQNVYNLAKISIDHYKNSNSYAANMIYQVESGAIARNIYSVEEFEVIYTNGNEVTTYEYLLNYDNQTEVTNGLNIFGNSGNVVFSYYFNDNIYENNEVNTKQDLTVLNDFGFQDNLLNSNGYRKFSNVEQDVKENREYPKLDLNNCMPNQDKIKLKVTDDEGIVDIVSSEVIDLNELENRLQEVYKGQKEKDEKIKNAKETYQQIYNNSKYKDNVKIAVFDIYDPYGRGVTEFNINYIDNITILAQPYNNSIIELYVVISDPTSFIDKYNIASVVVKTQTGKETKVTFGEENIEEGHKNLGERTIDVSFTKYIESVIDWFNIDEYDTNNVSGLIQNYKLNVDIDFNNLGIDIPENIDVSQSISGEFTGTFDGQGHTIRNVNTDIPLFETLYNGIKDLKIDGLNINNTQTQCIGAIGKLKSGSTLDNVHLKNVIITVNNISQNTYIGGLCGYIDGSETVVIRDSLVNGIRVEMAENNSYQYIIGGLIGSSNNSKLSITNCYVQEIEVVSGGLNEKTDGVGGIIGNAGSDSIVKIENCYTQGDIVVTYPYAGGIFGTIKNTSSTVKYCYSLVNITGNMTSGDEYIGGIGGYYYSTNLNISNNIYLGNIYIRDVTVNNSNRIIGNITTYNVSNKNYAYEDQVIIGKKDKTNKKGASKLVSEEQIFEQTMYDDLFEEKKYNYNYDGLVNNYLPKLNYLNKLNVDGTKMKLPWQVDNTLLTGITVTHISVDKKTTETGDQLIVKMTFAEDLSGKTDFTLNIENDDLLNDSYIIEESTVTFTMNPQRYYDTYRIDDICYIENGEKNTIPYLYKISIQLFKNIANVEDWNNITDNYENYKLVGNVHPTEEITSFVGTKRIGRLEGTIDSDGNLYTISGYHSDKTYLIYQISTNIKNIKFEDIEVKKSSNAGVICHLNAPMSNCHFDNITIGGSGDYKGIVSRCNTGSSMNNITINNVVVTERKIIPRRFMWT